MYLSVFIIIFASEALTAGKGEKKMNCIPVIDLTATGVNITRLRINAGFTVRDIQDIFGFSTPQAIYKW